MAVAGVEKYAALDSDGDYDEGAGWNDSEIAGEGELFFDIDEDEPPQPNLMFGAYVTAAAGEYASIATGNVSNAMLRTMATSGWSQSTKQTPYEYLMDAYEPRPSTAMQEDYPRLYNGEEGSAPEALKAANTPSGSFFSLCNQVCGIY